MMDRWRTAQTPAARWGSGVPSRGSAFRRVWISISRRRTWHGASGSLVATSVASSGVGRTPPWRLIDAITDALGLEIEILAKPPILLGERGPRDSVHARCSAYVDRRLASLGLISAREVEVADGRIRGWIDLLAFDPRSHTLYIIEIKTRLDDLGGLERQLGVYERMAPSVARSIGWTPHRVSTWLLVLATDEVERVLRDSRPYFARVFTRRAPAMLDELRDGRSMSMEGRDRGMALIDPRSRGRVWLIRSRVDGRRAAAPYRDYSDAARGHA